MGVNARLQYSHSWQSDCITVCFYYNILQIKIGSRMRQICSLIIQDNKPNLKETSTWRRNLMLALGLGVNFINLVVTTKATDILILPQITIYTIHYYLLFPQSRKWCSVPFYMTTETSSVTDYKKASYVKLCFSIVIKYSRKVRWILTVTDSPHHYWVTLNDTAFAFVCLLIDWHKTYQILKYIQLT